MNTSMIKLQSAMLVTLILMASCGPSPNTSSSPAPAPTPDASASARVADLDKRLTSLEQQIAKLSQQVGANSGSGTAAASPSIDPASVKEFTVQPSTVEVQVGAEATPEQVSLTMNDNQTSTLKTFNLFSYSVLDPAVATVDSNGTIKGLKEGATVVSMKIGSVTKSFGVLVKAASASPSPTPSPTDTPSASPTPSASSSADDPNGAQSISLYPESFSLTVGESKLIQTLLITLNSGVQGTLDNHSLASFTSSDTSVATVDAAGGIYAKAVGSATITVTYKGASKTVPVTVTATPSP